MAPAGLATYFNPLIDALLYVGIQWLSPKAFAAVFGAIPGTNVLLVWAVARILLGSHGFWIVLLATLLGATGQNAVSLLGTTFGDNLASIPALGALLAVVSVERPRRASLFLAGALGGAAVGLKLTMAAPHAGLALMAVGLASQRRQPDLLVAFGLGSLLGCGLTNGWWALELWRRLGNPVFPFLNDIFHSPFAPPTPMRDLRWMSGGATLLLQPAVDAALGHSERLQEVRLRDPRLLLVFLSLLAWLGSQLVGARAGRAPAGAGRSVLLYWIGGYAAWVAVFHYYRYATTLELLAPTVALVALAEAWPRRIAIVAPAVALAILLTTRVGFWYRTEWGPLWFNPRLPEIGRCAEQLILLPQPGTSFVAPFFPPDAAFVGLAYYHIYGPALKEAVAARVQAHEGPLRVLVASPNAREDAAEAVGSFELDVSGPCEWVRLGRRSRYRLCPLERRSRRAAQPAEARTTSSSTRSRQLGR